MLLELLRRDREPLDELGRREDAVSPVPTGREKVCEQRLEDAEALRGHGPGGPVDGCGDHAGLGRAGRCGGCAFMRGPRRARALDDEPAELGGLEGERAAVLTEDPAREQLRRCVPRREHVSIDVVALAAVRALDPPGGVGRNFDSRFPDVVPELPLGAPAVQLDIEVGRQPEVALAARREANVRANARDAERADVRAVEIVADHVPRAVLGQEGVRVERALLFGVRVDRPVPELHRALLRDRTLELPEAALQLRRVIGIAHERPHRRARRQRGEAAGRPAECEVLQREPQGLGVGEAPFEEVEARLEGGELLVVELQLRQEVTLGPKRVELLAGELVPLAVERNAERDELGAVGVEASRERLIAHLLVTLDVRLDVARGQRPAFRHQKRDQRQLTDQLVRIVGHSMSEPIGRTVSARYAATRARSRCWCDGQ